MKYLLILLLTGCSSISGYLGEYNNKNLEVNVELIKSSVEVICGYTSQDAVDAYFKTRESRINKAKFCGRDLITIPLRGE